MIKIQSFIFLQHTKFLLTAQANPKNIFFYSQLTIFDGDISEQVIIQSLNYSDPGGDIDPIPEPIIPKIDLYSYPLLNIFVRNDCRKFYKLYTKQINFSIMYCKLAKSIEKTKKRFIKKLSKIPSFHVKKASQYIINLYKEISCINTKILKYVTAVLTYSDYLSKYSYFNFTVSLEIDSL